MSETIGHGPYLIFDIELGSAESQDAAFGLDVAHVAQVLEIESTVAVPLAPSVVEGIVNHQGRILTIVDPAPLLDLPPQAHRATQVVILRRSMGAGGNVGVKVARIRDIVRVDQLEEVDVDAGDAVRCVLRRDRDLIHIVAYQALLAELAKCFDASDVGETSARETEGARP